MQSDRLNPRSSMIVLRCLVVCLLFVQVPLNAEEPIPLDPGEGGMSIDHRALSPGDIIVSTTTQLISKQIQKTTNSPVSHTMLYMGMRRGKPFVIEAVASGVRLVPMSTAFEDASLAVAFRHPKTTAERVKKLLDFANAQVSKKYDKWGIVQQLLCRKGGKLCKVSTENDKWYCSELVLSAFSKADMPLLLKKPEWKAPGDIAELSVTKEIEYVGHLIAN